MNDSELDLLLGEMRDEELPAGALAAVRARVQDKLLQRRRRIRLAAWLWAPAGVAVAALALIVLTPGFRPAQVLKVAVRTPAGPGIEMLRKAPGRVVEARAGGGRKAGNRGSAPARAETTAGNRQGAGPRRDGEALPARSEHAAGERTEFLKIYTDDPGVVILWAMNSKGETR